MTLLLCEQNSDPVDKIFLFLFGLLLEGVATGEVFSTGQATTTQDTRSFVAVSIYLPRGTCLCRVRTKCPMVLTV